MRLKAATTGGIIAVALLCAVAVSTLSTSAGDEGGDVIDQEYLSDAYATVIRTAEPIGQSFTPTASSLAAVDVFLDTRHRSLGDAEIKMRLRDATITGDIRGAVSRTVSTGHRGWARFVFSDPIKLLPGSVYVVEIESSNDTHIWSGFKFGNIGESYVRGEASIATFSVRTLTTVASSADPAPTTVPADTVIDQHCPDVATTRSVLICSATIKPSQKAIIDLRVRIPEPGLGAFNIDVSWDSSLLVNTDCESAVGLCGFAFSDNTIRLVGGSSIGFIGDTVVARLELQASNEEGTSEIDAVINQLTDPAGQDITVSATDGTIIISESRPLGDVDCDDQVGPIDALGILRSQTSLSRLPQSDHCPDIGEFFFSHRLGDLDCDNDVDSVDALAALRAATSLPPLAQHEPCPHVGSPL